VNEAARLADAAKERAERVLASCRSVEDAPGEASHWEPIGGVDLRGIGVVAAARPG
jgi:class 3 adenylate cyclase